MAREIRFKKQYKPIGFGDRPDPGTVESHRNAMDEAAETRRYNRRMRGLEAEDLERQRRQGSLLMRLVRFLGVYIRHKPNR
jgi:hypothetical protein